MAPIDSADEIAIVLERIRVQGKGQLSDYHRDLLKWTKNVDKRYAWVVLLSLWLIMAATLGPYRIYGLIFAKVTAEGSYTREEAAWPVSMIITLETLMGPVVSIVVYYISIQQSILLGGILLVLGNGLTAFSSSLIVDTLLLGVVQGIGYGFIFIPFMEVINNYFLKYRNVALGIALCGGTMSVFVMAPLFKWLLEAYPWRNSYLALGGICCIIPLMIPFLKPNPKPTPPIESKFRPRGVDELKERGNFSRISVRALAYQNSIRRQSTILVSRPANDLGGVSRKSSVISINPFASAAGLERKITRDILAEQEIMSSQNNHQQQQQQQMIDVQFSKTQSPIIMKLPIHHDSMHPTNASSNDLCETVSMTEIAQESEFNLSIIYSVLKTPAFHLIWFNELIYFWTFSIYCLVLVDYGVDRGCNLDEAESLLQFQSIGEIIGRIVLSAFVDMGLLSHKNFVILNLCIMCSLLVTFTQVHGFMMMAFTTTGISATTSLLYILLNGLLVECLGERQVTLGLGIASFFSGLLMYFRPQAVGYFRDNLNSYDPLMLCLASACAFAAILWIIEPLITRFFTKKSEESTNDCKSINQESSLA